MNQKNRRRLLILGILFIISTAFYLLFNYKDKILPKKETPPLLEKAEIKRIEIKIGKEKQTLEKRNGEWQVKIEDKYFPADKQRIENLKNYLLDLRAEKVVSQNAKKYKDRFNLEDYIKIDFANGKSVKLNIGKFAEDGRYAQIEGKNEVFIASDINNYIAPLEFRDLELSLISNEDKVTEIKIKGQTQITLKKEKDSWTVNSQKAKQDQVKKYLQGLKGFIVDDLVFEENPGQPIYTVEISEGSNTKTIEIFQKEDYYLIKEPNKEYSAKISKTTLEIIIPNLDNLKEQ